MNIAIIGTGLVGLTAALRLLQAGHRVSLFERTDRLGGLAASFTMGGTPLECYYHHVFVHDAHLRALVDELGLSSALEWLPSTMAVFDGEAMHPFRTPLDLLRFPGMSPVSRVRFGLATLYARGLRDWRSLERLTAEEWLTRIFGREGYQVIWEPLLRGKFGAAASEVSAAWIWGKIALRGSSKERGKEREVLGYMRGGFAQLTDRLAGAIAEAGGTVRLSSEIGSVRPDRGGWRLGDMDERFDAVVMAVPPPTIVRLTGEALPVAEVDALSRLEHQGAMVAVLALDRPLTPYYWVNVNAYDLPFGGLIEHTNFVPPATYGGRHVIYLSRYLSGEDPLWGASNEQVLAAFLPHLTRFNPAYEPGWLQEAHVFRAPYAQPVIRRGYGAHVPPLASATPGLYFGNMHHIYPEDRGMNYAIGLGDRLARMVGQADQTLVATVPAVELGAPARE